VRSFWVDSSLCCGLYRLLGRSPFVASNETHCQARTIVWNGLPCTIRMYCCIALFHTNFEFSENEFKFLNQISNFRTVFNIPSVNNLFWVVRWNWNDWVSKNWLRIQDSNNHFLYLWSVLHCKIAFFVADGKYSDTNVVLQFLLCLQDSVQTSALPVIGHEEHFTHQANVCQTQCLLMKYMSGEIAVGQEKWGNWWKVREIYGYWKIY